jgi:erythromycin esterase-like protein
MMARVILLLLGWVFVTALRASPHGTSEADAARIDGVVQTLCPKDVVLLGEDRHHGSAATLAVKVRLVERLVRQCGFRGIVFESQFYDMLEWSDAVTVGKAGRRQLADAIGAVWSRYPEFMPLVDWMYEEAKAGHLHVGGMDPQVGGITGRFSLQRLPAVLSSVLAGERRADCEKVIGRQDNWGYDDAHPFDDAALRQLRGCMRDIHDRLQAMGRHALPELGAMADSYSAYLGFAEGDAGGKRDRAMYRNFTWLRTRWPKGTRIIVWCATVHAAKSLPRSRPFGSYVHAAFGPHAATIGFSALGGSYGNVGGHGPPHAIGAAAAGSLEARAFAGAGAHAALRFVGAAQLRAMGAVPARAIDYARPETLDWSQVVDGVIVLRREAAAKAGP